MKGTIKNWGTKDFGFILTPELDADVWTHARFIADPGYVPRVGDAVEFDPVRFPDGRYQGKNVRRPGTNPVLAMAQAYGPVTSLGVMANALTKAGTRVQPATPVVTVRSPAQGLAEHIERVRDEHASKRAQAERQVVAVRAALVQRQQELEAVQQRIAQTQTELQAAEHAHAETVTTSMAAEAFAAQDWLQKSAKVLSAKLAEVRQLRDAVSVAATKCKPEVQEKYRQVRNRRATAADPLVADAFEALERLLRVEIPVFADAVELLEDAPSVPIRFTIFHAEGSAVLVAPVTIKDLPSSDDIVGRITYAFWHAAERCARELGDVEDLVTGEVGGLLAVQIRMSRDAADMVEILLSEAWAERPTLEEATMPAVDMVAELSPRWIECAMPESTMATMDGDERSIGAVSRRTGLASRDLIAALCARGLPFPDDRVEPGVEESLMELLGLPQKRVVVAGPGVADLVLDVPALEPPDGSSLAGRMLAKLLRDKRVGGRHTHIESAFAHHFSDDEKAAARRIADELVKRGILMPKLNEGSHQISINPRRLQDIGAVIRGEGQLAMDLETLAAS